VKKLLILTTLAASPLMLNGCVTGVASGVAQGAASNAISGSLQARAARQMTCEEIALDIETRNRGKINPLAIPSITRQIATAEAIAAEKGCPGYEAVTETE